MRKYIATVAFVMFGAACASSTADTAGDGVGSTASPTSPASSAPPAPSSSAGGTGGNDAGGDGATFVSATDADGDGISDTEEASIAQSYMPFISIHPSDACPTHGLLYRLSPHPKEPSRYMMWVDVLYNQDCGASGHPGDDEMFGVVIDPKVPAPAGILAVRGISHQGTPCEHDTTCGACKGMTACTTAARNGAQFPAVFPSKDKHGNYADESTCAGSFVCDFGGCAVAAAHTKGPLLNAGEPSHPLVHDLTTDGFVTVANGWTEASLLHFDPWKAGTFGGAGDVSKDLVDPAFVIDTTACP